MAIDPNSHVIWDLNEARKHPSLTPASHQSDALKALRDWYQADHDPHGGLLVLPTGGGKTFAAMRFLASGPLSDGYKLIWMAHTHHLLEQAHDSFRKHALSQIAPPKNELRSRVVSGTEGHYRIQHVEPTDDALFITLQTLRGAEKHDHPAVNELFDNADGKIFIVFDEAHHAPANSYRRLVQSLRERSEHVKILGLTATPTYTDVDRRGWLKELFPQETVYQVTAKRLMMARVLAEPQFEQHRTDYTPEFDDDDYQRWSGTHRDLPENIISSMAERRERNAFIAKTYADNKEKYGQTLIFADRWYQCEMLREMLKERGVEAEAIYSRVESLSEEQRKRRKKDHNAKAIKAFKDKKLDVIINIRMLTEGTDVPEAQSVFLTRQTTSQILLTQMIGRALRGPAFGGTDKAHIVAFIDDWRQLINFAEWGDFDGAKEIGKPPPSPTAPIQLISIDLIRRLARQMDSGINVAPSSFSELLPLGWYLAQYNVTLPGSDDTESVSRPVMVFNNEKTGFEDTIAHWADADLGHFQEPDTPSNSFTELVAEAENAFFPEVHERLGGERFAGELRAVARHMAQREATPRFFEFELRKDHDLDALAYQAVEEDWGLRQIHDALTHEFDKKDRFWSTLFSRFQLFETQFQACVNRILNPKTAPPTDPDPPPPPPPPPPLSPEHKRQTKERDDYTCLACGETNKRHLQVDHILSQYFRGSNFMDNLQTLCGTCNRLKGRQYLNFRDIETNLEAPPSQLPNVKMLFGYPARDVENWEQFLRRLLNFFFKCSAVHKVIIGKRGDKHYHWEVELRAGHNPEWIAPWLDDLTTDIAAARDKENRGGPETLTISAPSKTSVVSHVDRQPMKESR